MKYVLFTDPHLGIKKANDVYIQVFNTFIDDVCTYTENDNINDLIILGDFFDTRKSLSLKIIDVALQSMERLTNVFSNVYLIVGNHDTYFKAQLHPTSLSIFKKYDNVHIIDEPTEIDDILLLPWIFDKDVLETSSCKTCMGHFDINGIEMNASGYTPLFCRLNITDFSNFNKVISGHYHVPSLTGNIKYLGAPYQTTFNEINQQHGYYTFDSDTSKLNFSEFTSYPKHVIITDDYEFTEESIKGNNVRLIFTEDHGIDGNTRIIHDIQSFNPNILDIRYNNLSSTMTEDDIEVDISVLSKIDILHEYHKKADRPESIKLGILRKITEKIYEETIGE
jgi:DNA repair exonuclease SbcCD nuclease subunit